jgi:YVTN family beta-propeller protein
VALAGENALAVVDPTRREVIGKVAVGTEPHNVVVTPDGRWVFVTNFGADNVTVVDARTLQPARTIRQPPTRGRWIAEAPRCR